MPNALAAESSPYLRQHAGNPVDWLPWGEVALSRAGERQLPLLVSIGYSSCHWCHVMERESFEDERVAALMNARFVCVKVDREERPDVDAIYMDAVQAMTGQGGWPLNVFLTPEQLPFYGGTYFPPQPMRGMPSWTQVLEAIAEEWDLRGAEIRADAERIRERLAGGALLSPATAPVDPDSLDAAVTTLAESFDGEHGGFGGAPKFPQAPVIELLLGEAALGNGSAGEMALATLDGIVAGGIHDIVGGGFHRYAVDATWTVPHFEKMLYDNALLARATLRGWQLSGQRRLLDACLDTFTWALREMRGPEGGFYAALDADSEGAEGSFYVWTKAQLEEALGEDAEAAVAWTGASLQGNFVDPHNPMPGLNVLREHSGANRPDAATVSRIRALLLRSRDARPRPGLDDKRLTAWNALMISALAEAGGCLRAIGDDFGVPSATLLDATTGAELSATLLDATTGAGLSATLNDAATGAGLSATLLDAASGCAEMILTRMRDEDGRLLRTFDGSQAKLAAYLEDHGFLLEALLCLYEGSHDERWFIAARELAQETIARFADEERGGFFSTASDSEPLIARRKDIDDSPIPAGASSVALALLRLHAFTGEHDYERRAAATIGLLAEIAPRHPGAFGHLLQALRLLVSPPLEVAIVGPEGAERLALERVVRERLRPTVVLAVGPGDGSPTAVPLLKDRTALQGRPTAYVCRGFACERPVTEPAELARLLSR